MLKSASIISVSQKEQTLLLRLNAVRFIVILFMMFGYASTMSLGTEYQDRIFLSLVEVLSQHPAIGLSDCRYSTYIISSIWDSKRLWVRLLETYHKIRYVDGILY